MEARQVMEQVNGPQRVERKSLGSSSDQRKASVIGLRVCWHSAKEDAYCFVHQLRWYSRLTSVLIEGQAYYFVPTPRFIQTADE